MKIQSFRKLTHALLVFAFTLSGMLTGSYIAYGQLSAADIAALRQRGKEEGWTFEVGENSATKRPLSQLGGAVEPPDWREKGNFDPGREQFGGPLPSSFDWRAQASVPIRDQGLCGTFGSCWAFATVGPFEYMVQVKDGVAVDLSEQYLISCNTTANPHWDCDNGGWEAHDWHCNTAGTCGHIGAILEASYPYINDDPACTTHAATNHVYRIKSWAYVGAKQDTNPPVDLIKQAMLDHGPITVCVHLDSALQAYNGGIFNACSSGRGHMVVLVGWDDNQAGGVWFARNSWGTDWGEAGYMRIKYNCSNIGYAASYIEYAGADQLEISPPCAFASQGLMGGPFDPAAVTYTLHNRSGGPLSWSANSSTTWMQVSPASGSLPAGGSVNVTATFTSAANSLGPGCYTGWGLTFINNGSGYQSTRDVSLTVQRQVIYDFPLNTDPGFVWKRQGEWRFGQPTGHGGGSYGFPDPSSGFTGTNVYGVNLSGDYATTNVPSPWYYLTAGPMDLRGYTRTMLQFERWLNSRSIFLQSSVSIEVTTNTQTMWTTLWDNAGGGPFGGGIRDAYWTNMQCDLSAWDNCPNVYVRWGYKVPDATPCSGWNIDDIQFLGIHAPVITNQPASRTNDAYTTATFAVTAGALGPLGYHWVKNGTNYLTDGNNVSGATTPTLTITNVLGADRGSYKVVISNVVAGVVTSSTAGLTVIDPLITSQPASRTNLAGTTATFSLSAIGTASLGYQWVKNATNYLTDTGNVSGGSTTTLTLTNLAQSDAGSYAAIVTNPAGMSASSPAILTVLVPPAIASQPQSRTNYFGTTATFTVTATGTEPLRYQWRKGGSDLANRTDAILTLTNVGRRDNGLYAALVTNICDSMLSSNATLLVRVPQHLGMPTLLADGTCVILAGDADGGLLSTNDLGNFEVYASTNLQNWILLTNTLSLTNGQLRLYDSASTNIPTRFYQILEKD